MVWNGKQSRGAWRRVLCRQKDSRTPNPKQRHSYSFAQHATSYVWRQKINGLASCVGVNRSNRQKQHCAQPRCLKREKGRVKRALLIDAQTLRGSQLKTMTCDGFETGGGEKQGGNPNCCDLSMMNKRAGRHPCMHAGGKGKCCLKGYIPPRSDRGGRMVLQDSRAQPRFFCFTFARGRFNNFETPFRLARHQEVTDDVCVCSVAFILFHSSLMGLIQTVKTYSVPRGKLGMIDHPTLVFEASLK